MDTPGFSGEAAIGPLTRGYKPIPRLRSAVSIPQRTFEPRGQLPENLSPIQREPTESGRAAWKSLEQSCSLLRCSECRDSCQRFINGLHDMVNVTLGKRMQRTDDFLLLRNTLSAAYDLARQRKYL